MKKQIIIIFCFLSFGVLADTVWWGKSGSVGCGIQIRSYRDKFNYSKSVPLYGAQSAKKFYKSEDRHLSMSLKRRGKSRVFQGKLNSQVSLQMLINEKGIPTKLIFRENGRVTDQCNNLKRY